LFDERADSEQPAHCCHCLFNFLGFFVVVAGGGNEQYTCCHSSVIFLKILCIRRKVDRSMNKPLSFSRSLNPKILFFFLPSSKAFLKAQFGAFTIV